MSHSTQDCFTQLRYLLKSKPLLCPTVDCMSQTQSIKTHSEEKTIWVWSSHLASIFYLPDCCNFKICILKRKLISICSGGRGVGGGIFYNLLLSPDSCNCWRPEISKNLPSSCFIFNEQKQKPCHIDRVANIVPVSQMRKSEAELGQPLYPPTHEFSGTSRSPCF